MKEAQQPHSLIVGGSKGLGHVLADTLLGRGHKVSVLSRKPPAPPVGETLVHFKADIRNTPELSAVLDRIVADKIPLNHLIFVQRHRGDEEAWKGEIETSLTATKIIIESLTDKFAEGGSIVIVTSVAARFIADEQPVGYHVAKAGLEHMARYYAVTLGPKGIRCNIVSPSVFIKERTRDFHATVERASFYRNVVPLGRPASAVEVCNVVAFLCSADASYVTGQNIAVDGGLSVQAHLTLAEKLFSA